MIDMSELLCDPDFCEEFKILRGTGAWVNHRWEEATELITVIGIATSVNKKDFEMLAEGDRVSGLRTFYTKEKIRGSSGENTADVCEYHGEQYKIIQVFNYSNNGFYKAIGRLIGGV